MRRTIGPIAEIHVLEALPPSGLLPAVHRLAESTRAVFAWQEDAIPTAGLLKMEPASYTLGVSVETLPTFTALATDIPGQYDIITQLAPTARPEETRLYAAAYTFRKHEGGGTSINLRAGNIAIIALARIANSRLIPPEPIADKEADPVHIISTLARTLGSLMRPDQHFTHNYVAAAPDSGRRAEYIPAWVQF